MWARRHSASGRCATFSSTPSKSAVKQGHARSLMPSYNEIDGIPSHANRWMLRDVLRREWGFDGTIVSDWQAISQLAGRHQVAEDAADAARQALAATVDVELPDVETYHTLVEQVKQGKVAEAAIDDAVRRLLREKFELGLFEDPFVDPARADEISGSAGEPAAGPGGGASGHRAAPEPRRSAPLESRQDEAGGGDRPARGRGDARRLLRRAPPFGEHARRDPPAAGGRRDRRPRGGGADHRGLGVHPRPSAARRRNALAGAVVGRPRGPRRSGRQPAPHRGGGSTGPRKRRGHRRSRGQRTDGTRGLCRKSPGRPGGPAAGRPTGGSGPGRARRRQADGAGADQRPTSGDPGVGRASPGHP